MQPKRRFDQITAAQLALACAIHPDVPFETTYRIDNNTIVHATVTDQTFLSVWLEDAAGITVHRYDPYELRVVELEGNGKQSRPSPSTRHTR